MNAIPVWRTLTIGTHRSGDDIVQALLSMGFVVERRAADILRRTTVSPAERNVKLVQIHPSAVGFQGSCRQSEFYERAMERGLGLCTPEIAGLLRLGYIDMPYGSKLSVAMIPVKNSRIIPPNTTMPTQILILRHESDGQWLGAERFSEDFDPGVDNHGYSLTVFVCG
jgi:hypothetical protein